MVSDCDIPKIVQDEFRGISTPRRKKNTHENQPPPQTAYFKWHQSIEVYIIQNDEGVLLSSINQFIYHRMYKEQSVYLYCLGLLIRKNAVHKYKQAPKFKCLFAILSIL